MGAAGTKARGEAKGRGRRKGPGAGEPGAGEPDTGERGAGDGEGREGRKAPWRPEPRFYSRAQAAHWLGVSVDTLERRGRASRLYAKGKFGYHLRQLEIIAAHQLGNYSEDEATRLWEAERTLFK